MTRNPLALLLPPLLLAAASYGPAQPPRTWGCAEENEP